MYRCCTDPETGEKFGWGRVLDYIGVGWDNLLLDPNQVTFDQLAEMGEDDESN